MILNETVLSVALPPLMAEFGVGATTIQWLTTGFLLTMAVVIPTTGYLLSRFSIRTLFIAALILCSGTALAAVAPNFGIMLARPRDPGVRNRNCHAVAHDARRSRSYPRSTGER